MLQIQEKSAGLQFKILVQPRSSRNCVVGVQGDALKIKLTSPPVKGAANKMCVAYLAKCLEKSKSSVEIVSGHASRIKQILVKFNSPTVSEKEKKNLIQKIEALAGSSTRA